MSDGDGPPGPPSAQPLEYYSFDRVAAEYEATRYMPAAVAAAAAALICDGLSPTEWLLDAGIGTGRLGRALALVHGRRTTGIDVSSAMMREMRRAAGRACTPAPQLAQADLRSLPFAAGVFRRLVVIHVLHLIADWQRALAETWRTLEPGGALFLGIERRSRTEVREFYLRQAGRSGVLTPIVGAAHSADIRETLISWGARIHEHAPESLSWEHALTIRETLAMLERRTYSVLWTVPEETHRELMRETERYARNRFGTLDHVERASIQLVFYEAKNKRPG